MVLLAVSNPMLHLWANSSADTVPFHLAMLLFYERPVRKRVVGARDAKVVVKMNL